MKRGLVKLGLPNHSHISEFIVPKLDANWSQNSLPYRALATKKINLRYGSRQGIENLENVQVI